MKVLRMGACWIVSMCPRDSSPRCYTGRMDLDGCVIWESSEPEMVYFNDSVDRDTLEYVKACVVCAQNKVT